jgi:cyanophycin synthetase
LSPAPEARRLTGPHLLGDWTGAGLDVDLGADGPERLAEWRRQARRLLDAVGWEDQRIAAREFTGGANLAISAPLDVLYAATDVAEAAWAAATQVLAGESPDPAAVERLAERIARERNPRLLALAAAAESRGVTFLHDDDGVSIGSGTGCMLFDEALPSPATVDWSAAYDIPVALVTGSNGKTTTVRLAAAMAAAAGHVAGFTSTDGVVVGGEIVERTDFAGPMGARMVLRDRRVTLAVLETARGGILRRGLAVRRADAVAVTNIAEDHFGDFGVASLDDLAAAKLVTTRIIPDDGAVILNADDPTLAAHGASLGRDVTWFSLDPAAAPVRAALAAGRPAYLLQDDVLVIAREAGRVELVDVDELPAAAGGAARYNVANALAASAVAGALRARDGSPAIPVDAVRSALRRFGATPADNAGRGNLFELGGVRIVVDYAHNPHGLAALTQLAGTIPAERRLIVLGQAGDRTDDAIRGLARAAWELRPDRILLKELDAYRRGRPAGQVREILADELARLGVPLERVEHVQSEVEAARRALSWARPGDLLLLLCHEDRAGVTDYIATLSARGWTPGAPLE